MCVCVCTTRIQRCVFAKGYVSPDDDVPCLPRDALPAAAAMAARAHMLSAAVECSSIHVPVVVVVVML